ncbi:MAG: Fic family protein [Verrucomicrobia bacterium]|nr:Fic family protein [Verrucomicrobiota bacterium]MBV8278675.1 Fic family protein [Verrucomicrobiota bacterium]
MKPEDFSSEAAGRCQKTPTGYWVFLPRPLPPNLEVDWGLAGLLSEAASAIAELSGAGRLLHNPHLLIRPYIRREAILSSRIENTIADMEELVFFEVEQAGSPPRPDVQEVANYVHAMEHGLKRINELPISKRLLCEMHGILLADVRGGESNKAPGEFRRSQNWIGRPGASLSNATFVPPPPEEMLEALSDWEKYLHAESSEPLLVKCAILHYQLEAIHPFIDGNGRIGRLLITLFLCSQKFLSQPLLYLSGFFDQERDAYYDRLLAVSQKGDWRGWIEYFLTGVKQQARSALQDTEGIVNLYEQYRNRLKEAKRAPVTAAAILDELFGNPVFSITRFTKRTGHSFPTANTGVQFWLKQGLLQEATGQSRNRLFVARELLDLTADRAPKESNKIREGTIAK